MKLLLYVGVIFSMLRIVLRKLLAKCDELNKIRSEKRNISWKAYEGDNRLNRTYKDVKTLRDLTILYSGIYDVIRWSRRLKTYSKWYVSTRRAFHSYDDINIGINMESHRSDSTILSCHCSSQIIYRFALPSSVKRVESLNGTKEQNQLWWMMWEFEQRVEYMCDYQKCELAV